MMVEAPLRAKTTPSASGTRCALARCYPVHVRVLVKALALSLVSATSHGVVRRSSLGAIALVRMIDRKTCRFSAVCAPDVLEVGSTGCSERMVAEIGIVSRRE